MLGIAVSGKQVANVKERATMALTVITFDKKNLDFNLDSTTGKWTEVDPSSKDLLDEGDFPLVAFTGGKRYELYSDGTFAEVEL
jgi:hypothetical protein